MMGELLLVGIVEGVLLLPRRRGRKQGKRSEVLWSRALGDKTQKDREPLKEKRKRMKST